MKRTVTEDGWTLTSIDRDHGEKIQTINNILRFNRAGIWWHFSRLKDALNRIDSALKQQRKLFEKCVKKKFGCSIDAIDQRARVWWALAALDSYSRMEVKKLHKDLGALDDLLLFLEPSLDEEHPSRIRVWIPGSETCPEENSRAMMRLIGLLGRWNKRIEPRGIEPGSIVSKSNLRKAKKMRKQNYSIPKIVEHLHPERAHTAEREKLIQRYQRALGLAANATVRRTSQLWAANFYRQVRQLHPPSVKRLKRLLRSL